MQTVRDAQMVEWLGRMGAAGAEHVWVTTQHSRRRLLGVGPFGRVSRRRSREPVIDPERIQQLPAGSAAVLTFGTRQAATITRIHHPSEARPADAMTATRPPGVRAHKDL